MKYKRSLLSLGLCAFLLKSLPVVAETAANSYGPVQPGDLIWDIAIKVRPDEGLSRYQVMQALLAANPQAFSIPCNINSPLKIGETLHIPSTETIQQLSKTEARQQFGEQSTIWKNARGRRADIECPEPVAPSPPTQAQTVAPTVSTAEPLPPSPSVTVSTASAPAQPPNTTTVTASQRPPLSPLLGPTTLHKPLDLSLPPPAETEPVAPPATEMTSPAQMPTVAPESASLPPTTAMTSSIMHIVADLPAWVIALLGGLILLVLGLMLGIIFLLLRRKATASYATVPSTVPPPTPTTESAKMSTAVWGELPAKKTDKVARDQAAANRAQLPANESIERQLANIRTCLAAEGETQAVRVLLREVMDYGTETQQAQAQQLLEIGRKMHWLEERKSRTDGDEKASATSPSNAYAATEAAMLNEPQATESRPFPLQRYLPEEQARIFELVDKIFELLDDELAADGQLVEAYVKRHQRDDFWDSRNYKVIDKIQTPFPEPPPSPPAKGRDAKNNPRYL